MSAADNERLPDWGVMIACSITLILGILIGGGIAGDAVRAQAIKAKVAHWTVNPETGEKKFEYLTPNFPPPRAMKRLPNRSPHARFAGSPELAKTSLAPMYEDFDSPVAALECKTRTRRVFFCTET